MPRILKGIQKDIDWISAKIDDLILTRAQLIHEYQQRVDYISEKETTPPPPPSPLPPNTPAPIPPPGRRLNF